MQAVLIEAEALACVQLVILALIANNGLAFEGGQDGIAGSAVRSQASALVKSHQDKFHVVCMSDVQIGDAALFIRNEVLQFGGLACLDNVVHGKILLFQNDFGIDHSTVGFCAAQCFRRYIQHFSGFDRHFLPIDSQKKLAVSLTTQIKSGAVIVFRGNRSACAQGKPCYRHSIAQSGRSGNGHSIPDRANLGKCKRDIVHTAVSSRRATGTMLRTDRP